MLVTACKNKVHNQLGLVFFNYSVPPSLFCLELYHMLISDLSFFQDRENPDIAQGDFQDIPFLAQFASGSQELSPLLDMPGVDGFVFNVDPLYKVIFFM